MGEPGNVSNYLSIKINTKFSNLGECQCNGKGGHRVDKSYW